MRCGTLGFPICDGLGSHDGGIVGYLLDEMMRDQKIRQMYQSQSWRMLCCVTYLVYQLVMDFDYSTVRLLVHLLDDTIDETSEDTMNEPMLKWEKSVVRCTQGLPINGIIDLNIGQGLM